MIENLDSLQYLQHLNLSCNQLESLIGIPERLNFLEVFDVADNQVKSDVQLQKETNFVVVVF